MKPSTQRRTEGLRGHQVTFSLIQLRLVGILILFVLVSRIIVFVISAASVTSTEQLSGILLACAALPLLPLGLSLYMLGASYKRNPHERKFLSILCQSMPAVALFCGVFMPGVILYYSIRISNYFPKDALSPYQAELIGSYRIIQALVFCWITGAGLFLLYKQNLSFFKKYGVDTHGFFNSRKMIDNITIEDKGI